MTLPPHSFRSSRGGELPLPFSSTPPAVRRRFRYPPATGARRVTARHLRQPLVGSPAPPPCGGSSKLRETRERPRGPAQESGLTHSPTGDLLAHPHPPPAAVAIIATGSFFFGLGLARERGLPRCPVPRGVCFVLRRAVKQRGGRAGWQAVPVARFPSTCCVLPASRNRRRWPAPPPLSLSLRPARPPLQAARPGCPAGFVPVRGDAVSSGGFWGLRSAEVKIISATDSFSRGCIPASVC